MSKCRYCKRELIDSSFKTANGCIWCDFLFHQVAQIPNEEFYEKYYITSNPTEKTLQELADIIFKS